MEEQEDWETYIVFASVDTQRTRIRQAVAQVLHNHWKGLYSEDFLKAVLECDLINHTVSLQRIFEQFEVPYRGFETALDALQGGVSLDDLLHGDAITPGQHRIVSELMTEVEEGLQRAGLPWTPLQFIQQVKENDFLHYMKIGHISDEVTRTKRSMALKLFHAGSGDAIEELREWAENNRFADSYRILDDAGELGHTRSGIPRALGFFSLHCSPDMARALERDLASLSFIEGMAKDAAFGIDLLNDDRSEPLSDVLLRNANSVAAAIKGDGGFGKRY